MATPAAAQARMVRPEQSKLSGPEAPYTYGLPTCCWAQATAASPWSADPRCEPVPRPYGSELGGVLGGRGGGHQPQLARPVPPGLQDHLRLHAAGRPDLLRHRCVGPWQRLPLSLIHISEPT